MATTKEYKEYVLETLSFLNVTSRSMMGEYLLYLDGVLFGGIYDNRVLIKRGASNEKYHLKEEIPYKGAKAMYLVDVEDSNIQDIILDTCKDCIKKD